MKDMDAMTVIVRFLGGAFIGGLLVLFYVHFQPLTLWFGIGLPVAVGLLTVAFGDRFLAGFLGLFRWLR